MADGWRDPGFIDDTIRARDWQAHGGRTDLWIERSFSGVDQGIVWACDAQSAKVQGVTSTSVTWRCPALGIKQSDIDTAFAAMKSATQGGAIPIEMPIRLAVRRAGPQTDLGSWIDIVRTRGRSLFAPRPFELLFDDPDGVLDADLRDRLTNWPDAYVGAKALGPARLGFVRIDPSGLVVSSSGWWNSAPALEHQIAVGVDIAKRLVNHSR